MTDRQSLDTTRYAEKIARIREGRYRKGDFMIADAKDADLSGGIVTGGPRRDDDGRIVGYRNRAQFLEQMRAILKQDLVDILLTSAANMEVLSEEGAFEERGVLAAFRGNETSDIWGNLRGGDYRAHPALPHRGADLTLANAPLCLYAVTFNNDAPRDVAMLEAYAAFRAEARAAGILHFLEVFNPNLDLGFDAAQTGRYVNDCILRSLASLTRRERPEFLKVAYNGPEALEELAGYDPGLVVGVLGGGSGTHRDTFELLAQAERFGARLALFGRKINGAEDQLTLIAWMRRVADGEATPMEAVRGYRADLEAAGLRPDRDLESDLAITEDVLRPAASAA
ncbi:MAG: hypothetical protein Kilf2KO_14800 [Rhodospirillales bacterium]